MSKNSGDVIILILTGTVLFIIFTIMASGSKNNKNNKKMNMKLTSAYNLKKECVNSCLNPHADIVGCEMQCGKFPYKCYIDCIGMIGDKDKCFAQCSEMGLEQSNIPDTML
jgi:hypothetical protein